MGYSESKLTIDRVREILDIVLLVDATKQVEIPSKTPIKTSYAIRDALKVAEKSTGADHKYTQIRERFILRTKPDRIIFDPREKIDINDPVISLAQSKKKQNEDEMVIDGVSTVLEIVGAAIMHKADIMRFPQAIGLAAIDRVKLAGWCSRHGYAILDDYDSQTLTLVKNNDPTSENDTGIKG